MRRSVSISVYHKDGRILSVTNRRWGGFTLPGGKVEPNEDIESAAWRELYEETGLVPDALRYLGSSQFNNPFTDDAPFLVSHYEAITDNHPRPIQMEEGTVPSWRNSTDMFFDVDSIFSDHYKRIINLGVIKSPINSDTFD